MNKNEQPMQTRSVAKLFEDLTMDPPLGWHRNALQVHLAVVSVPEELSPVHASTIASLDVAGVRPTTYGIECWWFARRLFFDNSDV